MSVESFQGRPAQLQSHSHAPLTRSGLRGLWSRRVECGGERGVEPIWGLWEAGDWAVDLGKEGSWGGFVGHCSEQALCVIGKVEC